LIAGEGMWMLDKIKFENRNKTKSEDSMSLRNDLKGQTGRLFLTLLSPGSAF